MPSRNTDQAAKEIIPASWGKAIGVWIFGLLVILVGALFLWFRWSIFSVQWYWIGGIAIFAGVVTIIGWDGLVPFRRQRLIIGSDSLEVREIGNRVRVHIPFSNIEEFHIADHYDREIDVRIPNYYLNITLKDPQDVNTRGKFETDKESKQTYLQLTDSYVESLPKVIEKLQARYEAFSQ